MRIRFLGTGDALSSGGRASMAVLLEGKHRLLLDCCPEIVYLMRKNGYRANDVEYMLITHLHGDHAGGIPFLLLSLVYRDQGKVVITGPRGTAGFTRSIMRRFFPSTDVSGAFEIRSVNGAFPFGLSHMKAVHTVPAYIYRIEMEGKRVVYTGDTSPVDLSAMAHKADLLIHEAASLDPVEGIRYGHSTPMQAAEAARAADVERLAIVHRPDLPEALVRKVKSMFPNTIFPEDGYLLEI